MPPVLHRAGVGLSLITVLGLAIGAGCDCGERRDSDPTGEDARADGRDRSSAGDAMGNRACDYRDTREQLLRIAAERPDVGDRFLYVYLAANDGKPPRPIELIRHAGPVPKPLRAPLVHIGPDEVSGLPAPGPGGPTRFRVWKPVPLTAVSLRAAVSQLEAGLRDAGAVGSPLAVGVDARSRTGWLIAVARAAQRLKIPALRLLFEQSDPIPQPQADLRLLPHAFRVCRALLNTRLPATTPLGRKVATALATCPCGVDGPTIERWVYDSSGRLPLTEVSVQLPPATGGTEVRLDPERPWRETYRKLLAAARRDPVALELPARALDPK